MTALKVITQVSPASRDNMNGINRKASAAIAQFRSPMQSQASEEHMYRIKNKFIPRPESHGDPKPIQRRSLSSKKPSSQPNICGGK